MAYTNPWVGYIDRSYQQIKSRLLSKLVIKAPELTDLSESNILIIILSMFAGIAEMLNLYIDFMAQESFIQTARRLNSVIRLIKLVDYRVRAAAAASVDISILAVDTGGTPVPLNAPYTIPAFTLFTSTSGITYTNPFSLSIPAGEVGGVLPVRQISTQTNNPIGVSDGISPNQQFSLGVNYVQGSVSIFINTVLWTEVTSFGRALAGDKVFITEVHEDGQAWVIFGDNINGAIPPAGQVVASYYETLGAAGLVGEQTLTSATPAITLPTATPSTTLIYNALPSTGGLPYEDIDRIRVSAPLSVRTLDRAVTYQDYEDIARLCLGVGKAKVDFNCGKKVNIYIAPTGGGIASTGLLSNVKDWFEPRRMVTTTVNTLAAGETALQISMIVTAKFRADIIACNSDVQNALLDYGSFNNQNINRKVRISDIVSKVDNLPRVDYLTLTKLGTVPYARPLNSTRQLQWTGETLPGSVLPAEWLLEYDSTLGAVRVFKNQQYLGTVPLGITYTDPQNTFRFTILFGIYSNGMQWKFKTYPFLKDIDLDDFTVPTVKLYYLDIQVQEQFNPPI